MIASRRWGHAWPEESMSGTRERCTVELQRVACAVRKFYGGLPGRWLAGDDCLKDSSQRRQRTPTGANVAATHHARRLGQTLLIHLRLLADRGVRDSQEAKQLFSPSSVVAVGSLSELPTVFRLVETSGNARGAGRSRHSRREKPRSVFIARSLGGKRTPMP